MHKSLADMCKALAFSCFAILSACNSNSTARETWTQDSCTTPDGHTIKYMVPPQDVLQSKASIDIQAALPQFKQSASLNASAEREFKRIRAEVPGRDALAILKYYLAQDVCGGLISTSQYEALSARGYEIFMANNGGAALATSKSGSGRIMLTSSTPRHDYPRRGDEIVAGELSDLEGRLDSIEMPAICFAARVGNVEAVAEYLEIAGPERREWANAMCVVPAEAGFTPLHYAARVEPPSTEQRAIDIIEKLVAAGADLGARDTIPVSGGTRGETPLHSACEYCREIVAAKLVDLIVQTGRCELLTQPGNRVGDPIAIIGASSNANQDPSAARTIREAILAGIAKCPPRSPAK